MRNRKSSWVGLIILGCSLASGGCVDALSQGAADGLASGIAAVVESIITEAAQGLPGQGD